MTAAPTNSGRSGAIAVMAWREAKSAMRGMGLYIALTLALMAATWILLVDIRELRSGGVLVLEDPFAPGLSVAVLVIALFLAVTAAVSVARDRETGTLEVLFYGPVDELDYVLAKIAGLLLAYAATLPLFLASHLLLSLMTGLDLTATFVASLALSAIPAVQIVGFGVLLSIGTSRVRSAVLILVGVSALLIGITIAYSIVLLVPIEDPGSPVLSLRDALALLNQIAAWVSPYALLGDIVDAAAAGSWQAALQRLAAALAGTLAMIALAALWLRRRGVHRQGE